ncbi:MAG TPA: ABC transporter permease subunit [Candidatus Angelobacter sp.]|nr:ABC transporter permease subunit [Candidatus Angelobacter sp.]
MSDAAAAPADAVVAPRVGLSPFRASLRRFTANHLAVVSSFVLLFIAFACFVSPFFFPFGADDADFDNLSAPIDLLSAHLFGTDDLGRDLLLRVLVSGRVSLALGFFGAVVSVFISVLYGATAGYLGGRIDDLMMRSVDILLSVPFIFLAIVVNVMLGKNNTSLFIAVVVTLWLTPAVIARGQAVSLRNREFIEAARAGGMTSFQIILRHIAPNSVNVVIVYSSLLVLETILTESFLSFLGLGVQPPAASWGTLIAEGAQKIETDPRVLLLPGAFLAAVLFCLNYITDGLRDAFDPNER